MACDAGRAWPAERDILAESRARCQRERSMRPAAAPWTPPSRVERAVEAASRPRLGLPMAVADAAPARGGLAPWPARARAARFRSSRRSCARQRSRAGKCRCPPLRGVGWCERGDSNPHALRHWNLNPGRLPIPPLSRAAILTPRCAGGRAAGRTNENARPKPDVSSNWWAVKGEPGRWRTAGSNPATHPHNENARPKPGVSSNWWAVKDSNLGPID